MQKIAPNIRKGAAKKPTQPVPDALLDATRIADVVRVPARTVIAIEGAGPPEKAAFQRGVAAIYAVGFTLKFARKSKGRDFRVGPLEARWWAEPPPPTLTLAPRDTWRWQLRLGVPDSVTLDEVTEAADAVAKKRSGFDEVQLVRRLFIAAEMMGRILHVGPYSREGRSLDAAREAVRDAGLTPVGPHVEVYLSDPRRTASERLRTVLLLETMR